MRRYQLYLLDDQVATSYFGRESKLFQLFEEHAQAKDGPRSLLDKQVDYITKPLPTRTLKYAFRRYQEPRQETCEDTYVIQCPQEQSGSCKVQLDAKFVQLWASGDIDSETAIFDLLKGVDPHFFAVNVEDRRFGWLQPFDKHRVL
ncbi:sporulation inhibitor of replication protein SirA [Shouchella shacheensis]|uniref:sporulation inhibitor of replication protein SirA n=1 Tax=Shouchella shacheensis TaxID=1649580 RepID=UPI00074000FD|nr:sporulation inhibitor of replication protein SirA [Shouchella shacheensis]